jgi:flagellar basal-body rod protein FlgC
MAMDIFDVSGRAMSAQLVRLNTTASNLANAGSVAGSEAAAYRSRKAIFATALDAASNARATVDVEQVVTAGPVPVRRHEPGHPLADKDGYVWEAGVDATAEMVEMLETARQYQNNAEVLRTAKSLLSATLKIGQ